MGTVGSLLVNLKANTAGFDKKMKRSRKQMSNFSRTAKKTQQSLQMLTTAVGAYVGMRGLQSLVRWLDTSAQSMSMLGKTARKLGLGTKELGALRHAAQLTGIATTTLDMALQRMVRRIGEAAQGTGEAKAALEELGISAKNVSKLSAAEQFKQIADAMEKVQGPSQKLRLAFKLFDSEGAALVNTLALGRKGIDDVYGSMDKLGQLFGEDTVNKMERVADSIDNMKKSFSALGQTIAVKILVPLSESLTAFQAVRDIKMSLGKEEAAAGLPPPPPAPPGKLKLLYNNLLLTAFGTLHPIKAVGKGFKGAGEGLADFVYGGNLKTTVSGRMNRVGEYSRRQVLGGPPRDRTESIASVMVRKRREWQEGMANPQLIQKFFDGITALANKLPTGTYNMAAALDRQSWLDENMYKRAAGTDAASPGTFLAPQVARGIGGGGMPIRSKDETTHKLLREIKTVLQPAGGGGGGFGP